MVYTVKRYLAVFPPTAGPPQANVKHRLGGTTQAVIFHHCLFSHRGYMVWSGKRVALMVAALTIILVCCSPPTSWRQRRWARATPMGGSDP
jgi:hypothetical protein